MSIRITLCFSLVGVLFSTCIDPIEFDVESRATGIVVDGYISNVSYVEKLGVYPEAEKFFVQVSYVSRVSNEYDKPVLDAEVKILDDQGNEFRLYDEDGSGKYEVLDPYFKALPDRSYKVAILTADGRRFESLPERIAVAPPINKVHQQFEKRTVIDKVSGGSDVIGERGAVKVSVELPKHEGNTRYYRWKIVPSWIFSSSLLDDNNPNKTCYITNKYYFRKINVKSDIAGGYAVPIFLLDIEGNARLKQQFTALIIQYSHTSRSFDFWEKLSIQQASGGGIFDPPPFQINGNIRDMTDPENTVMGYFNVVHESSYRWFINQHEQPYDVRYSDQCEPTPGVPFLPRPECLDCHDYNGGMSSVTNEKPVWF